ncbi:replication protein [Polaribacter sp. MSW13]|uniref:Replication protein n=1 Tax=Polaribacter marinus TaxID=2916838 RepID=A0A9X2AKD1_9FLAO|nr:replication protein [Polaribacter marinus]MCI2229932.1 replication protein [Polaribacter marinus]
MTYYPYTNVPNVVFDYLPNLSYTELKVLLLIIRQTFGWMDKETRKQKQFDWISIRFFAKKTGLSKRAISDAIAKLIQKKLIIVKNEKGKIVHHKLQRRRALKLYFSFNLEATCAVISL